MGKNKILSKLNIRDYNNELEKILENKLFSYDVKNLLLSMLYKIENAYRDYETVKVEVPSKKEFIENILRIIREKALKILLVKPGAPEAKELEQKNVKYKVDKENGEIVCFQNEFVMLTALLKLDQTNANLEIPYDYLEEPLIELINQGRLDSMLEVIRDFNGWSWDIVTKEIGDIKGNFLYQNLLLLNGKNANIKKSKKMYNTIIKMSIQKYLANKENEDYIQKFEEIKKAKKERLELFEHKRDLLDKITEEKKEYTKQIEQIDRILNNNELLKKEYYERNKNLPNKEKIFSVSYLVGILEKERKKLLEGIEECNKIILPKEYVEQKSKLEEETRFLESIQIDIYRNDIVEICKEFLENVKNIIKGINEENKNKLITWIYKIRYYRYIPISETESVKDLQELNELFEEVIKLIIKKLQKFRIWDTFSENQELNYNILKEIFNTKIIYLQSINIQCRFENKVLIVEYYDDTVIDNSLEVHIDSVKIKKKFKLFM